jgi:O-antigen ligase
MNSPESARARLLPSDWLLSALIFATPFMKPSLSRQVIGADLLFVVLALAVTIEVLLGLRRLCWIAGFGALVAYVAGPSPSLLATSDLDRSLFKYATEFYLIGLAGVTAWMIDSEIKFRRAVLAWLAATALVCLDGVLSLVAFATGRGTWLLDYSGNGFGSLPPGNYPRLALTFFGANMACNYLTVSLALAFLARNLGYTSRSTCWLLLAGIAVAALSTISAGLGGIALLAGLWLWVRHRGDFPPIATTGLVLGLAGAAVFVIALVVMPIPHPTAPFLIRLPGGATVYGAGHLLTWSAALKQFLHHPLIGIGLGIDPIHVGLANPTGFEVLTDSHNIFLSIAAQCGLAGLAGLAALLAFVIARTPWSAGIRGKQLPQLVLGATFLDVFVYQGLGGSFEDTRHIWVLLGLFMAANRIELSRGDESNRRAGAPSPC